MTIIEKLNSKGIGVLLLLMIALCIGCGSGAITEERIKVDLIGKSIEGAYIFDAPSEFIDVKIRGQEQTGEVLEVDTEFILEDYRTKELFYLHALLIYRKQGSKWVYDKGHKVVYSRGKTKRILE